MVGWRYLNPHRYTWALLEPPLLQLLVRASAEKSRKPGAGWIYSISGMGGFDWPDLCLAQGADKVNTLRINVLPQGNTFARAMIAFPRTDSTGQSFPIFYHIPLH